LHLLHIFPSFQIGGSQRRFAALANHFGSLYRHTIISLDNCWDASDLLNPAVSYTTLAPPPKASLLPAVMRAQRVISVLKPDLLVTYNWGSIEWATANLSSKIRHVHIEDGFGPEEAHKQLQRRVLFRRLVLNHHSRIVLPSRTLVNAATEAWRISPDQITYVPNGIPSRRFEKIPNETTKGRFRGQGPIIGTVATLRKEKAIERLIYAFQSLQGSRPARLVIVGDGPERAALEQLVTSSELTESVTFTGNLSLPEDVIKDFDIFAISSDTEQMPLSVLEGMAAGLPIVSPDVGDVKYMVADQNLPFIVEGNACALAQAMSQLLSDATLSRSIGNSNRARVNLEFDEQQMFLRYQKVFSNHA